MSESKESLSVFLHWFSWAISLLASVFFLIYLVTEDIPNLVKGNAKEIIPYLPFLILAILGCFLSLVKRKPGAIMMIVGGIAIVVILYIQGGSAKFGEMVVYGLPYIFPGIILLLFKK